MSEKFQDSVLDQIIKGQALVAQPVELAGGYEQFMVVPAGLELKSLEHLRLTPRRVKELVNLSDATSLCDYVNRFKTDSTIVEAHRNTGGLGNITAIIDYHLGPEIHGWCAHKAYLPLSLHRRFQAWVDNNSKAMTQSQFAEFLDDHILDITTPPGAEMVEMVQWLEATSNASFKSVLNLTNGRTTFSFADPATLKAQGTDVELPRLIGLLLPVIEGGDDVSLNVQLRYRLESDKLKLFYRIPNLPDLLDKTWLEVTEKVKTTLELPFYRVK